MAEIAANTLSPDQLTREFIRAKLDFRFLVVPSPAGAFLIERQLQRGD